MGMSRQKNQIRGRVRLSPEVRQKQIVQTAHRILVEEGYAQLSYSKIAKLCEIRLSTVQYHFPDRSMLIGAVMKQLLDELLERYVARTSTANAGPGERVEAMVRILADDIDNHDIASLFFELWAFSLRDPVMAEAMDSLYVQVRTHLAGLIVEAVPGIARDDALRRAIMIMAMADGLTVAMSHGARPPESVSEKGRDAIVTRLVRLALEG